MISVVIIARNEEKVIGDAIESANWADEVVVVDTGSIDKTKEVAKKAGAKVVDYTGPRDYSSWRNKGLKEASGDWILYLDADERITPLLKKEILKVVSSPQFSAYAIPRRNFIFGKEFKHSGQYPDYQKRLFLKEKFSRWEGPLHEEPHFEGGLGHLDSPMVHLKQMTLEDMMDKTNWWSDYEAKLMYESNHPPMNVARFFSAMAREFWLRMIKQVGFLDGTQGVIYALYQVYSRFVSYAKLWEMQQK
jgi:glycosyltransferase involved in cell wall biosynthesis